jgi:hypothetical protein
MGTTKAPEQKPALVQTEILCRLIDAAYLDIKARVEHGSSEKGLGRASRM